MEILELNAQAREEVGKGTANRLRKSNWIPAIVMRKGKKTSHIKVNDREFLHLMHAGHSENIVVKLLITDEKGELKKRTAIMQDVQHDPVKDDVLHIDFREISLKERVEVPVKIDVKGEAKGVTVEGGVLEHAMWEITVECLPTEIPEHIVVDVTELGMNESIHVKDLVVPEGIVLKADPELAVIACEPPAKAPEEPSAEEEVLAEGGAEPEVIKQKAEEEAPAAEKKEEKKSE